MNKATEPKLKIKICIANYRPVHYETLISVNNLLKISGFTWHIETYDCASIPQARTFLIRDSEKYNYILFVDTDMAFNNDDFLKLLSQKKPIINGAYKHINEARYVGSFKGDNYKIPLTSKGVMPCEFVPLGFTLIESAELKDICFEMPAGENNLPESEDYNFCKKKDGKVFIHFETGVKHLPREKCVYLDSDDWADILKGTLAHPMPYIKANRIVSKLNHYLHLK